MLEATRRNVARLKLLIDDLLALSKAEGRDHRAWSRSTSRCWCARWSPTSGSPPPGVASAIDVDDARRGRAGARRPGDAAPGLPQRAHQRGEVQPRRRDRRGRADPATAARPRSSVTDHGIGIPAAEIDRLGTRFFRASNAVTNEIAGTGLGLRIMQTIIDKHAGDVVIDSEEGDGTTVWVRLQRYADGCRRRAARARGRGRPAARSWPRRPSCHRATRAGARSIVPALRPPPAAGMPPITAAFDPMAQLSAGSGSRLLAGSEATRRPIERTP